MQHGANVVLAPTHLLETAIDQWRSVDFVFCQILRQELDRVGGGAVAIDYQLITTNAALRDKQQRPQLIGDIDGLLVESRASARLLPGQEQGILSNRLLTFTSSSGLLWPTAQVGLLR